MSYHSSYDTGGGPFRPNKDRGIWSSPSDFIFACLCNVIRMDCLYGLSVMPLILNGEIRMVPSLIVNILLYSFPVIFIQAFVGQFSSSGFLSVFRISPLFKGLGYIGLALNLISLTYFTVYTAIPLVFFFYSLQPTLPWSCEGSKAWYESRTEYSTITHCNVTSVDFVEDRVLLLNVPSVDFFRHEIIATFSLPLYGCVLVVWGGIAYALYNSTERIGQIFRYCSLGLVALLVIVSIRVVFLPGVTEGLRQNFFKRKERTLPWEVMLFVAPMLMFSSFGPGWGTILSMASYNKFETNITKYSALLFASQLGVYGMIAMVCLCTEYHLTQNDKNLITPMFRVDWTSFLTIPSALASFDSPHLWTWMFLAVLVIGSFNLVLVQMFSILTALFDEFEQLRPHRKEVIFGLTAILALISAAFCSHSGFEFIEVLADLNIISQTSLNLALLAIVLWIYGRERFQRDMKFMTGQVLASWTVFLMRFVTPVFIGITLFVGLYLFIEFHDSFTSIPMGASISFFPWVILPAYCVYRLTQGTGHICLRVQRCLRPNDWYPVDLEDNQRYTEAIANPEALHPLTVEL